MKGSLRWNLVFSTAAVTAAVLGVLGIVVYLSVQRSLLAEFDDGLRSKAQVLASLTEMHNGKLTFEFDASQLPEFTSHRRPEYFEVLQPNGGAVLGRSPLLGTFDLAAAAGSDEAARPLSLPDGRAGRLLRYSFTPAVETDEGIPPVVVEVPRMVVIVARDTVSLDRTLARLRLQFAGVCGIAIVVTAAVLMTVVSRSLRPVDRLSQRIEGMSESDLGQRLAADGVPVELTSVVDRLNGLLGRLEEAFVRERSFTADVAHELRTPLAGLRATLEVCRSRPRDAAGYEFAIDKCQAMLAEMHSVMEGLLMLARADAGQLAAVAGPFDAVVLLDECWDMVRDRAASRGLSVERDIPPRCVAESDREKLRIIFNNLLDNAVSYANTGGQVRLSLMTTDGELCLTVANTGSQVAAADAPNVLRRFWRGDEARDVGVHCGLGLSLCQRLVHLLGGSMGVSSEDGGTFEVCVRVPVFDAEDVEKASPSRPSRAA